MQHLQGAPKTASVGEPRPRLCLLGSWLCRWRRWRWIARRDLLVQRLQVVVLTICAGRVTFGNPVNLGCSDLSSEEKRNLNSLVSRFDEGDTGRGDRDRRTTPTESRHNHLCTMHIYTDTAATETQRLYVPVVIVSISNVRDNNDIYVGNKHADAHPKYEAKEKGGSCSGRQNHDWMGSQNQRRCKRMRCSRNQHD